MNIKLTKHSHFIFALIILLMLNAFMPSIFVVRTIFGFLAVILIVMWVGFAIGRKESGQKQTNESTKN